MASFRDYVRLKKAFSCYDTNGGCKCSECPISSSNNGKDEPCGEFVCKYFDDAEKIIDKWCAENPVKTRKDELLKIFPNAKLDENGIPKVCPSVVSPYKCSYKDCCGCQKKFWMEEIE